MAKIKKVEKTEEVKVDYKNNYLTIKKEIESIIAYLKSYKASCFNLGQIDLILNTKIEAYDFPESYAGYPDGYVPEESYVYEEKEWDDLHFTEHSVAKITLIHNELNAIKNYISTTLSNISC